MSKNLIFVGGGGYFREIYDYILDDIENNRLSNINLKGVISEVEPDNNLPIPFLSLLDNYSIDQGDIFLVAIGQVAARKRIFNLLEGAGAQFLTYIHHTAIISNSATVGAGSIVCPNVIVNANASIDKNCSINVNSSIGHDTRVGPHSVLSPYSALNGHSSLGRECFVGSRSTVFPKIEVGDCCVVDSHTAVRRNIEPKMIVTSSIKTTTTKNRFL